MFHLPSSPPGIIQPRSDLTSGTVFGVHSNPPGVSRYKWYSAKLEGIFALLDVHQVEEGCTDELAAHLGYPIKPETRSAWQAIRAWRADQLQEQPNCEITVASLDEFKVGQWWVYTLTDQASQAVVDAAPSESRSEAVVRNLIAKQNPSAFISDGCPHIKARSGT